MADNQKTTEDLESNNLPTMPMDETKKQPTENLSNENLSVQSVSDLVNVQLDRAKEKKLLATLDLHFVPIIMFAYLTCFLDRGNIGMTISFSILRI
jgi:phosphoribosylaminoimidazole carboxylase (NCAIR synthetase)